MIEDVRRIEEISHFVGVEAIKLIRGPEFVGSQGCDMALGTARETATMRTARSASSARALSSASGTLWERDDETGLDRWVELVRDARCSRLVRMMLPVSANECRRVPTVATDCYARF